MWIRKKLEGKQRNCIDSDQPQILDQSPSSHLSPMYCHVRLPLPIIPLLNLNIFCALLQIALQSCTLLPF